MEAKVYDVVVVGGGSAGLSAALVLGRARRRVVVVDGGARRNAPAEHLQGFLSRDGMPPADLLAAGRAEGARYGVELIDGQVVGIGPGASVRLSGGRVLSARRILITTGVRDELPRIPGVRRRWGRDLLHCPYCHGWEVRDQVIGVLGTQRGAVQHAQLVRQWADDVVFFVHTYTLTSGESVQLRAREIQIVHGEVVRLVVEADRLTGVELADGRVIPRSAVFIRPDNVPHPDGMVTGLGCEVDEAGFVVVDGIGPTSTFGVWAAGNAVDPRAQVIASAGAGNAAAIAINADLVQEDVERAVDTRHPARVIAAETEAQLSATVLGDRRPRLPAAPSMRTGAFPCPGRTALDAPAGCVPLTEGLDMPADPTTPTPAPVPPPSKHQLALMIWLAVLPTLLVLGLVLDSLVDDSPTVVRTVVLATIAVPIVMYGLLPRLHRLRARVLARRLAR